MKEVMVVTVELNISEVCTVQNMALRQGNLIFAMQYAARDARNRCPKVPATDVRTVLKT